MTIGQFKTLGLSLPDDVKPGNFWSLIILAFLVNASLPLFHIIQPIWLEKVIKIDPAKYGAINSNLQIIMELMQIAFLGYIGIVSDRFGRKILLWTGFLLFGIFFYLYGQSADLSASTGIDVIAIVYCMRGINAFLFLLLWPQIITLIADYSFVENRGRGMGIVYFISLFGAFFSLVFISYIPKLSGIMTFFYIGPVIGCIGFLVALLGIKDRKDIGIGDKGKKREKKEWRAAISLAKKNPGLRVCFVAAFAARADQSILGLFLITWAVKVAGAYGKTPEEATAVAPGIMAINVMTATLCSPLWGYLTDRTSRKFVMFFSLVMSTIGYVWFGLLDSPYQKAVYPIMVLLGMGVSGLTISAQTLTADLAPKKLTGSVLGVYNTAGAIGILFFAFTGGYLFDHVGFAAPFLMKGIADALAMFYTIFNWRHISHHKNLSSCTGSGDRENSHIQNR